MQLEHSFTVPTDIDRAWATLLDIERIAPCMPGAALETVDGDDFTGTVKVRLGPIGLTYKGKASFVTKDEAEHRAVIDAQGRDARGNGTAAATVTATLRATAPGETQVQVVTDLNITGKPAQFGRGVMVDVGNKLIGQFADCLAGKLTAPDLPTAAAATAPGSAETSDQAGEVDQPTAAEHAAAVDVAPPSESAPSESPATGPTATPATATPIPTSARPTGSPRPVSRPPAEVEPIDLLGSAGPALAKRLAPVVAVAVVIIVLLIRRRRS